MRASPTCPDDTRSALAACAAMSRPTRIAPRTRSWGSTDATSVLAPAYRQRRARRVRRRADVHAPAARLRGVRRLHAAERRRTPYAARRDRARDRGAGPPPRTRHDGPGRTRRRRWSRVRPSRPSAGRPAPMPPSWLRWPRRLTPPSEEEALARRSYLESWYRFESGEGEASATILEDLIAQLGARTLARVALLASLARVRHFQLDVAAGVAMQRQALAEAGSDDELRGFLEESLAEGLLLMRADVSDATSVTPGRRPPSPTGAATRRASRRRSRRSHWRSRPRAADDGRHRSRARARARHARPVHHAPAQLRLRLDPRLARTSSSVPGTCSRTSCAARTTTAT